jgi:GTP cyclohydrolase I
VNWTPCVRCSRTSARIRTARVCGDAGKRFLKAWSEYTSGYKQKPEDILKSFEDGAQSVDEMVIVRDIPVYSLCEHHLAPFFGKAHVGYVPDKRILGLSKISRLVEVFARRLQVQERLTNQIADALDTHLQPLGVAVVIECRHMCMESRGVRHLGTQTATSALRGSIKTNAGYASRVPRADRQMS